MRKILSERGNIEQWHIIRSKTAEEFNQHINWSWLEDIMLKYAPEALGDSNNLV